jgi:hypothetical protein
MGREYLICLFGDFKEEDDGMFQHKTSEFV